MGESYQDRGLRGSGTRHEARGIHVSPVIFFYISGHGFGHASRQIEVMRALCERRPDLRLVVRTSAPRWLFDLTLGQLVEVHDVEADTGVVQIDSLRLDATQSVGRAWTFHRDLDRRAAREARVLEASGALLVVGDIPPIAFAAAARVGLPAVAVANFTWDWIYEGYPEQLANAPGLLTAIRDAYSSAAVAWRLPLSGGFTTCPSVIDVPFIARRSCRDPESVRHALGLPTDRPLALVSFGRYGLDGLDWDAVGRLPRYGIVRTDDPETTRTARDEQGAGKTIFRLDEAGVYASGLRYEDLVAAVDVVVTKPGYGIIAECIANDTAILYTTRCRFPEYEVLVTEMPRFTRCVFIDQNDLRAGRWAEHLDKLLAQAAPPERPATTGADIIADGMVGYL